MHPMTAGCREKEKNCGPANPILHQANMLQCFHEKKHLSLVRLPALYSGMMSSQSSSMKSLSVKLRLVSWSTIMAAWSCWAALFLYKRLESPSLPKFMSENPACSILSACRNDSSSWRSIPYISPSNTMVKRSSQSSTRKDVACHR